MPKPLHLLTLREVCATGSFAVAARRLGYTAPAVSQHIGALERETGLTLFERSPHSVRPTAAAHRLVELSRGVLTALDELDHEIHRLATGATGRLRMGAFPTAGVRLVPPALSAFSRRRPGADVTLTEGEPGVLVPLLVEGELDLVLVYEYALVPAERPPGVTGVRLLDEDLLLLVPRHEHGATGPAAGEPGGPGVLGGLGALGALAGERWITSGERTGGARSLTRLCAAAGFTPDVAFRSDNYDVVRELVAARLGVALVPALGHVPDERVAAAPLRLPEARRTVSALYRTSDRSPLLGEAVDALRHFSTPAQGGSPP